MKEYKVIIRSVMVRTGVKEWAALSTQPMAGTIIQLKGRVKAVSELNENGNETQVMMDAKRPTYLDVFISTEAFNSWQLKKLDQLSVLVVDETSVKSEAKEKYDVVTVMEAETPVSVERVPDVARLAAYNAAYGKVTFQKIASTKTEDVNDNANE